MPGRNWPTAGSGSPSAIGWQQGKSMQLQRLMLCEETKKALRTMASRAMQLIKCPVLFFIV